MGLMTLSVQTQESPLSSATVCADQLRIIRAIASSTAIETGQTIQDIEHRLLSPDSAFGDLDLAALAPSGA